MAYVRCPVCDSLQDFTICNTCGYDLDQDPILNNKKLDGVYLENYHLKIEILKRNYHDRLNAKRISQLCTQIKGHIHDYNEESYNKQILELNKQIQDLTGQNLELNSKLLTYSKEKKESANQIEELKLEIADCNQKIETLERQLKASQNDHLQIDSNPIVEIKSGNKEDGTYHAGDVIQLGEYEIVNYTTQPIEWIILDINDKNQAIIISKYIIDKHNFNSKREYGSWETCDLNIWLNRIFKGRALKNVKPGVLLKRNNEDEVPTDLVFLLSLDEARILFENDIVRKCQSTDYCNLVNKRPFKIIEDMTKDDSFWWLRSKGGSSSTAACVYKDGKIYEPGKLVTNADGGVRPSLFIDLNKYDEMMEE